MKSTFRFITFLIISTFVFSQSFAQTRFGVRAGLNSSNLEPQNLTTPNAIAAPQFGFITYSDLDGNNFFVQSGLLFNVKGFEQSALGINSKVNYNFLEIPVNLGYNIPVGNFLALQPYVGAFAGYAISGKVKVGNEKFDIFNDNINDIGDLKFDPKRFDYGVNGGLGLKLGNNIILNAQYSHGLSNLGHSSNKIRSRTSTFGVTYLF